MRSDPTPAARVRQPSRTCPSRRRHLAFAALLAVAPAGCRPPLQGFDLSAIAPVNATAPVRISANVDDEEDPMVVAALDGTYRVVWWAKRDGQVDLFIRTSRDGQTWTDERRLTNDRFDDFYPWLLQARDGAFHLVWFRMSGFLRKSIWYASSPDGVTWSRPRRISGGGNNWVPSLYEDANRILWALWSSDESGSRKIVTSFSADGGRDWSPPRPITSGAGEDDFPQVVLAPNGDRLLSWARYRPGSPQTDYISDPSAQILTARSRDGLQWTAPVVQSPDNPGQRYIDALPFVFTDRTRSRTFLAWTSSRPGWRGDVLVRDLGAPRAPIRQLTDSPAADYGARFAPTTQPGEFVMVWISTADGGTHVFARRVRL